jgi:hypothetical protein
MKKCVDHNDRLTVSERPYRGNGDSTFKYLRILDPGSGFVSIPDPDEGVKKAPDVESATRYLRYIAVSLARSFHK